MIRFIVFKGRVYRNKEAYLLDYIELSGITFFFRGVEVKLGLWLVVGLGS